MAAKNNEKTKEKNNGKNSRRHFRLWLLSILFFIVIILAFIVTYVPQFTTIFNNVISGKAAKKTLIYPTTAKGFDMEKRFVDIEEKLSELETKIDSREDVSSRGDTLQLVREILVNLRKMPEIQEKLSNLRIAIEAGRPFDKEYEEIKPYIAVSNDKKDKITLFIKTSNLGVKSYEQLKISFQEVGAKILYQLPKKASWQDRIVNFFKSLFSIRPKARIIDNPKTPTDYVVSIEAMLELRDLNGILKLLDQSEDIKQADYKNWQHAFRDYCFAIDMHKMLAEQAYALNFKGL